MLQKPLIAFGEVLWDVFPDEEKLQGAPLTFSYYYKKAGGNPKIISALGKGQYGERGLEEIKSLGLDISQIQIIEKPTGRVTVSLNEDTHTFHIHRNTAWEHIQPLTDKSLIFNSSGIYLGTVARISKINRNTLNVIFQDLQQKSVFVDLNLRHGFYNKNRIAYVLKKATYLKLNEEEVSILKEMDLISGNSLKQVSKNLISAYELEACCITLGSQGAIGSNKKETKKVNGILVSTMGDTVGAGDAFAGTWFANLLKGESMENSLKRANEIASKVVSQRGAIIKFQ